MFKRKFLIEMRICDACTLGVLHLIVGLLENGLRFFILSDVIVDNRKRNRGISVIWIQFKNSLKALDCLTKLSSYVENIGEIKIGFGGVWILVDDFVEEETCRLEIIFLKGIFGFF